MVQMLEDISDSIVPPKECTESTQISWYGARNPEEWACSAGHWHPVRSVIYTTKIFWLTSWLMGLLFMWFDWWKWARKTKRGWRVHFQRVVQPWNLLPRNVNVRTHSHLSSYKIQRHCFRPYSSFGQLGVKESNVQTWKFANTLLSSLGELSIPNIGSRPTSFTWQNVNNLCI